MGGTTFKGEHIESPVLKTQTCIYRTTLSITRFDKRYSESISVSLSDYRNLFLTPKWLIHP